jgi:hypothetical protein
MLIYILTKHSPPSDEGKMSHYFYGATTRIGEARAWFRATRTTDVFEVDLDYELTMRRGILGNESGSVIRDTPQTSWRQQQFAVDKALAIRPGG